MVLSMGIVFFILRFRKNVVRLRSILKAATRIRELGKVKVVVSDAITVPFSVRFGRSSWVVLPTALLESGNDFRMALRHELEHHRQNDTSWAITIEVLICFFFLNPAMFFWKREIIELQEFACDEALVGRKSVSSHEYGSCLVRVAEAAFGSRKENLGTTCMAAVSRNPFYFKSFLRRRIEMFTSNSSLRAHRFMGIIIGIVASVSLMTLAFGADRSLRSDERSEVNAGEVVVDLEIQEIADRVLAKAIRKERAKSGFAIVADPNTGKILAVANIDTTKKRSGYWSLSEAYEPASVMKTLVAAAAIEKGLTSSHEKHGCENSNYRYGDRVYHDWKKTGWDFLTTEEAIAFSSDICTIKIGEKIGADRIAEALEDFGFGPNGTAKDFPAARSGQLPPPDDVGRPRIVPYASMGVGFNVTPIEMIQAYGAIANGGNLMVPRTANTPDSEVRVIRRVLSRENAEKMKEILRQVTLKGTAKKFAQSKLYTTAGKTATSHYPRLMPSDSQADFGAFIGFAPVKAPRVEVYVGIRDPESDTGAHGANHAAPVFKELAEEVLKHLKVEPDKPQS
ncbi:MAG: penicillin-binding transpeptidase domain-containing protein [Bdellovibrionota bacterium]